MRRLAPLVGAALLAGACGGGGDDRSGDESELSGSVVISGSSTVEPITIAVAEAFNDQNPEVDIPVDGPGTGDGFKLFCDGEIDINDASSKISEEQVASCEENGVELIELQIGNDGIAILTNAENEAVTCLNFGDLYALTGPESQRVDRWNDAEELAKELGSTTDLPAVALDVVGPGEESGTFASYVDLVLSDIAEEREQPETTRADYQASADDNVIIQGIQGSETSLGWVGFAFARDAEGVKVLEVAEEGGGECIAPSDETIANGTYPVSRPLFIYVNKAKADENEALARFVDFYLGDAITAVSEVGYVDLAPDALEETRARWEARTVGAR